MILYFKCPACEQIINTKNLNCPNCNHSEWKTMSYDVEHLQCNNCERVLFRAINCPHCGELILPAKHQVLRGQENTGDSSNNSGCFITEACCRSMGHSDDCYELQTFRSFRDNWLKKESDGITLIDEYYFIAPKIVELINNEENSSNIYRNIWNTYLSVCLHDIEKQDYKSCKERYICMVNELKNQYL